MKLFSKNFIGIDIGTSSIKVVELGKDKGKTLSNYGILGADYFMGKARQSREKGTLGINESIASEALSSILKESGIKSKDAFFAIPDYATFFTTFNLPAMSESEIPEAVKYEAPRRIPLPLSEVTLDWQLIKGGPSKDGRTALRVLLVAVPNDLIAQYQKIALSVGLKVVALEAEVFALVRALVKYQDKSNVVCLVDIGERSTTINIVAQGILKVSYSFDVSGENFTDAISKKLQVDTKKAETIKRIFGVTDKKPVIQEITMPIATAILEKIKSIFDEIYLEDKERAGKVILAGNGATLIGFSDYLSAELNLPVEIANPFLGIAYPPTLDETLKKLGSGFTIAVGMALRGFNK
ncbi:MAG: type IV pilus assembly protein PilM [Patescibacteria group bacterium]|nr:type IV pilus assembly protein PilM [Patescibacteria group bacterium]